MGWWGRCSAVVIAVLVLTTSDAAAVSSASTSRRDLERRVRELERQNADLLRRLQRLERRDAATDAAAPASASPAGEAANTAAASAPETAAAAAAMAPAGQARDTSEDVDVGMVARYGRIRASFELFGDAGFGYANPSEPDTAHGSFAAGTLDLFSTAQIGERFQALSEIVFEGDSHNNEFGVELERLWGAWSLNDALSVKVGREHSLQNRWDRRYHHGRWLWTSATQPFLARFEDDGGPLLIHQIGLEVGGRLAVRPGVLEYAAVVANGRGRTPEEIANFGDRNGSKAYDLALAFSPSRFPGLAIGGDFHADEIPRIADDPSRRHAIRELVESAYLEYFHSPVEVLGEIALIQHADRTSDRTFHHRTGYLQLAYRIGALTPYVRFDGRDMSRGDPFYAPENADLDGIEGVFGFRYDLNEAVAVKLEGGIGREQRRQSIGSTFTETFERFAAQLAWAF